MSQQARVYQLETTNYCNAVCSYCPHGSMKRAKGFVSNETVSKVIKNCLEVGQTYIALHHMGEPLLHPEIGNIITSLHYYGIYSEISTNGLMLRNKGWEILTSKIKLVRIAIDFYYNKPGYLDSIKEFLILAEDFPNTEVRIHTVDGNDLSVFDKYLVPGKISAELKVFDNWGGQVEGESKLSKGLDCYFQKGNYVVVLWNGDVVPCCLDFNGDYVIGQVDNLATIHNEPCKLCNTCPNLQFAEGGGWKL